MYLQVFSNSNKYAVQIAWRFITANELKGEKFMETYEVDERLFKASTEPPRQRPIPEPDTTSAPPPTDTGNSLDRASNRIEEPTFRNRQSEREEERENRLDKPNRKSETTENEVEEKTRYEWRFVDWTPCSASCGRGMALWWE